jgi:hypothetical protein
MIAMKIRQYDAEARIVATIYAGQVIIFAMGVWHYAA